MWQWREQYGRTIVDAVPAPRRLVRLQDERFTLGRGLRARRRLTVFKALYDQGLIYRDNYLVNWDPGTRSAISDLEVEDREVTDTLYYIDYPLADGDGSITVATVRPETMLADTAVAVNPDDERYARPGRAQVILPLVGRRLKVIADEYVKPEFGTGALKITPGHDPNDFEIGRRHGLEEVSVIGEEGLHDRGGRPLRGADGRRGAQRKVVEALEEEGRIAQAASPTRTPCRSRTAPASGSSR